MKPLQLKVTMMPATRRADGSVTVKLVTMEELSTEQFALIDQYRQTNGWMMFGPNQGDVAKLPKEAAEGRFTPSQLLRLELLKLHIARGGTEDNFQPIYEREMAQITAAVRDVRLELTKKRET